MKRRRVKITGIGPVTPAGIGREAFWKGILEPVSRVRPFKELGDEYGPLVAAYLEDFEVERYIKRTPALRGAARHTIFAVAASSLALQDAGLGPEALRDSHTLIVTGTSVMDFGGICSTADSVFKYGAKGAMGRAVFTTNVAGIASTINQTLDCAARTMALQSSCCSGLDAVGHAASMVARGEAEIALCGGTEAPLHRHPILEIRAAGLTPASNEMPERIDRPFDLWRTTGVVSEGACMFILEPESSPRPGYSFVAGYGFANDQPNQLCGGLVEAMELAIADARLSPHAIEAINAWGPGHRAIDAAEARALAEVFHEFLAQIPVVSIKGALGNALGAAPAIQLGVAALAQRASCLPPTVNWQHPDPECPLNLSARERNLAHNITLVNSHGLAGVNATMVLERCL
jgi:3-oxoacyl-(acyl-carrier-protein) synthase